MSIDIKLSFFLDRDRCLEAALTANSQAAGMEVKYLQTQPPREVYRSTNVNSTQITIPLAQARGINALALIRHNLTVDALVHLYGHSVNDFSNLSAVDFKLENQDPFPPIIGFGEGGFGEGTFGGQPDPEDMPLYSESSWFAFADQELRYWFLKIEDPTNPDGYIQIGRMMLGTGWQPQYGIDWDHSIESVDPSKQERTDGGGMVVDIEPQYRRFALSCSGLTEDERYMRAFNMMQRLGRNQAFFMILFPDPAKNDSIFEAGYVIAVDAAPIARHRREFSKARFVFEELI